MPRLDKLQVLRKLLDKYPDEHTIKQVLLGVFVIIAEMQTEIKELLGHKLTAEEFMNKYGGDK